MQSSTDAVGVEGNSRLTAVNGVVLLVVLLVEGVTILAVDQLITLHIFVGVLLVGPVLLKCASTVYRFVRYYAGAPSYVRKGPPNIVLRALGPLVILSSLAVLGTGIGLIYTGPTHREPLLTLHQASFIVWLAVTTIHVLGHLVDAVSRTWREVREPATSPIAGRRSWRTVAVVLALVSGAGLAGALLPAAHDWTSGHFDRFRHDRVTGDR